MTRKHAARIPEYLRHILDAIDHATAYVDAMDATAFENDSRTQDAVLHNLQIIGEAAGKIRAADPQFAIAHPDIPWDLISSASSPRTTGSTTALRMIHGSSIESKGRGRACGPDEECASKTHSASSA